MEKEENVKEIPDRQLNEFGGILSEVILPPKPEFDFVDFAIE